MDNFKILCYYGIQRYVYVHQTIDDVNYRTFFEIDWNMLNFQCDLHSHPTAINLKPKNFELMKKYASKLSKPFIFVRVDFYVFGDEIRLGELTFTPMNGFLFCRREDDIELGKFLQIS